MAQTPKIDDTHVPKSRRRVAKFNVENGMRTLCIIVKEEEDRQYKMIKSSAKVEKGQW